MVAVQVVQSRAARRVIASRLHVHEARVEEEVLPRPSATKAAAEAAAAAAPDAPVSRVIVRAPHRLGAQHVLACVCVCVCVCVFMFVFEWVWIVHVCVRVHLCASVFCTRVCVCLFACARVECASFTAGFGINPPDYQPTQAYATCPYRSSTLP